MELNSLLFPSPSIEYSAQDLEGEVAYIPRFFKFNAEYLKLKSEIDEAKHPKKKETSIFKYKTLSSKTSRQETLRMADLSKLVKNQPEGRNDFIKTNNATISTQ